MEWLLWEGGAPADILGLPTNKRELGVSPEPPSNMYATFENLSGSLSGYNDTYYMTQGPGTDYAIDGGQLSWYWWYDIDEDYRAIMGRYTGSRGNAQAMYLSGAGGELVRYERDGIVNSRDYRGNYSYHLQVGLTESIVSGSNGYGDYFDPADYTLTPDYVALNGGTYWTSVRVGCSCYVLWESVSGAVATSPAPNKTEIAVTQQDRCLGKWGGYAEGPGIYCSITTTSGFTGVLSGWWMGELFDLPGESGVEKYICADSYSKYNYSVPTYFYYPTPIYSNTYGGEWWEGQNGYTYGLAYSGTAGLKPNNLVFGNLDMDRRFIYRYNGYSQIWKQSILVDGNRDYRYIHPYTSQATYNVGLMTGMAVATPSDYRLKDQQFGSYEDTTNNIIFTWSRADRW